MNRRQKLFAQKEWIIGILSNLIVAAVFFGIELFLDNKLVYSSFIVLGFFSLLIPISFKIASPRLPMIVVIYVVIVSISGIVEYKLTEFNWITLETDHIHLGDVVLETFKPPNPVGASKTYKFNLDKNPSVFKIKINLKDVDPDERNGPLALYLNGALVMYLNKYFSDITPADEHKASWRLITIDKIPPGFLKIGANALKIAVEETERYGFDDINFYGLAIGYK